MDDSCGEWVEYMGVASGWNIWVWLVGVVSRRWMWVESMGVTRGCGCKEVYTIIDFLISLIPTLLFLYISILFLQQHPYFLFIFYVF